MRTVTFSNAEVAESVNSLLLPTWLNRSPGFHNCELSTERRIVQDSFEAYATKNFVTFFATPDLEVLHYFSGYYSPKLFLQELKFVKDLAGVVLDEKRRLIPGKLGLYRAMHEAETKRRAEESKKVRSMLPPKPSEVGQDKAQLFTRRRDTFAEGLKHLGDVHQDLAKKTTQSGKPVHLTKVLSDYLFGNSFTEEKDQVDDEVKEEPPKKAEGTGSGSMGGCK